MGDTIETVLKKRHGQAGPDGQAYLRSFRLELRVSYAELSAIRDRAKSAGFTSVAQFVREQALHSTASDSPTQRHKAVLACGYELNRIGNNINQIVRALNAGRQLDDEMLLVMMQVQDIASEHFIRVTAQRDGARE